MRRVTHGYGTEDDEEWMLLEVPTIPVELPLWVLKGGDVVVKVVNLGWLIEIVKMVKVVILN